MIELDVRPWEKLEASPSAMSVRATSSSDMQLATVGSGVGIIPELTLPCDALECPRKRC